MAVYKTAAVLLSHEGKTSGGPESATGTRSSSGLASVMLSAKIKMEPKPGYDPGSAAYHAAVLPLNYIGKHEAPLDASVTVST